MKKTKYTVLIGWQLHSLLGLNPCCEISDQLLVMNRGNKEKVIWRTLAVFLTSYLFLSYYQSLWMDQSPILLCDGTVQTTSSGSDRPKVEVFIDKAPRWRIKNFKKVNYRHLPFVNRKMLNLPIKRLYIIFEAQLGNNLFQLASAIGLSILTGRQPYFILRNDVWHQTATELLNVSAIVPVLPSLPDQNVPFIQEEHPMTFDTNLTSVISSFASDVVVCCYLQSWKYFIHTGEKIRNIILANIFPKHIAKADQDIRRYAAKVYPDLSSSDLQWTNLTTVGIQVRRGDKVNLTGYNVASKSYFDHGMAYFRQKFHKVLFIIASQDHEWSNENIKGPDVVHTDPGGSAAEDLTLLSRCNHTLGSVGSYTWWAGWLAGGITLYYKNHTHLSTETDYWMPDFVPFV